MAREKRRSPRIRCRIPCEVRWSGGTSKATVRDVSQGGLSLQSSIDPAEGESMSVELRLKHGRKVAVEGLVWHRHRVRARDGATSTLLGIVVSNPPEPFLELSRQGPSPAAAVPDPGDTARTLAVEPEPEAAPVAEPEAVPVAEPEAAPVAEPERDPGDTLDPDATIPPVPEPGRRFQVRVKQEASPRSRVLSIEADSADEAAALALERAGSGWAAIEVNAV